MNKIIFIMDEGIGNMIMATPALQAIKKANPKAELTVYGRFPALDVLLNAPFVDNRVDKIAEELRYDLALMSIWNEQFAGKYDKDFCKVHFKNAFKANINNWDSHESTYHMALARDAGYQDADAEILEAYVAVEQDIGKTEAIVHQLEQLEGVNAGIGVGCYSIIAISDTCLGGEWERKRWDGYPELAQRFIDDGYSVVLIGGDKEKKEFQVADYPDAVLPFFDLSLPETAYLLTQCVIFVGNDSGPAHIAGALGMQTSVLFGPTRWTKNKPLGKNVEIIRQALPCSPCQANPWWNDCSTFECLTELPVDFVYESVMGRTIAEQESDGT